MLYASMTVIYLLSRALYVHMLVLMHKIPHGSLYMPSILSFSFMRCSCYIVHEIAYILSIENFEIPKSIIAHVMIDIYDVQLRGILLDQKLCLPWYFLMMISITSHDEVDDKYVHDELSLIVFYVHDDVLIGKYVL